MIIYKAHQTPTPNFSRLLYKGEIKRVKRKTQGKTASSGVKNNLAPMSQIATGLGLSPYRRPGSLSSCFVVSCRTVLVLIVCSCQSPSFKWAPGVFYTCFYNHAHRLRLEKLLCVELSRSPSGYFKPLLDPGDRFASETAARRFQKLNSRYVTVSEVKRFKIITAMCNGHSPNGKKVSSGAMEKCFFGARC